MRAPTEPQGACPAPPSLPPQRNLAHVLLGEATARVSIARATTCRRTFSTPPTSGCCTGENCLLAHLPEPRFPSNLILLMTSSVQSPGATSSPAPPLAALACAQHPPPAAQVRAILVCPCQSAPSHLNAILLTYSSVQSPGAASSPAPPLVAPLAYAQHPPSAAQVRAILVCPCQNSPSHHTRPCSSPLLCSRPARSSRRSPSNLPPASPNPQVINTHCLQHK